MTTTTTMDDKAYIASEIMIMTKTVNTSTVLAKGTILGRVTTTAKLKAYASGASDGSQEPVCVLLEDVSATGSDVNAICGFAGMYKKSNMTGLDANAVTKLETKAIYFI